MPQFGQSQDGATESDFLQTLTELKSHYREFCWESQIWPLLRNRRSPYRVMVLFGLSARTRDRLLVETCRRFFEHFPDAQSMMRLCPAHKALILSIVRKGQVPFVESLASKLNEWNGHIPRNEAMLFEIVGVGAKIAECVLAYGWGDEALPMDGNGCRLHQRLIGLPDAAKNWNTAKIRDGLKGFFLRQRAWMDSKKIGMVDIHELLRLHSQLICGRNPECQRCPITHCLSRRREFQDGDPGDYKHIWRDWRDLILEPEQSG